MYEVWKGKSWSERSRVILMPRNQWIGPRSVRLSRALNLSLYSAMSSGELPVRMQSSTQMARMRMSLSILARKTPGSAELARNPRWKTKISLSSARAQEHRCRAHLVVGVDAPEHSVVRPLMVGLFLRLWRCAAWLCGLNVPGFL